jgi:hypothetical protein
LALPPKEKTTVSARKTVSVPAKVCRLRTPAGMTSSTIVIGTSFTPWLKRRL